MRNPDHFDRHVAEIILQRIVNTRCWYVLAGGMFCHFSLFLGDRRPRIGPVPNPMMREDARCFQPQFELIVYDPWRLDGPTGPVTGWLEPSDNVGPMVAGLEQMEGQTVLDAQLQTVANDLNLTFINSLTLRTFHLYGAGENQHLRWTLYHYERCILDALTSGVVKYE